MVTGITPIFVMLSSTKARVSVNIVLGTTVSEEELWTSFHEFAADAQQRYRKAYAITRESLCAQANRRKDIYMIAKL